MNITIINHDIHAFCLSSDQPLSWEAFSTWLGRLRHGAGDDLLRVKGILNLIGESAPVVIHGVHHIFHPPVLLDAWPDSDHRSRIVFIVRADASAANSRQASSSKWPEVQACHDRQAPDGLAITTASLMQAAGPVSDSAIRLNRSRITP